MSGMGYLYDRLFAGLPEIKRVNLAIVIFGHRLRQMGLKLDDAKNIQIDIEPKVRCRGRGNKDENILHHTDLP